MSEDAGRISNNYVFGNLTFTDGITRAMKVLFIKRNEALLCFSKIVLEERGEAEHRGSRTQSSDAVKWKSFVAFT